MHDLSQRSPPVPPQTQLPVWHVDPGGHLLAHAPQLFESFARSMHCEPHCDSVPGHEHLPFWQELPSGHWLPHVPQFRKSFVVSTHIPPHII